jgi:hypothetical protein
MYRRRVGVKRCRWGGYSKRKYRLKNAMRNVFATSQVAEACSGGRQWTGLGKQALVMGIVIGRGL